MHPGIPTLAVDALADFVAQRSPGERPILLDVREAWEREQAAFDLEGADTVHIPMSELPQRLSELDGQRPILGLCHHGMRSLQCVAFLAQQGCARVYNIAGGIDAWSRLVDPSVPRY